jgi:hypothetical protein
VYVKVGNELVGLGFTAAAAEEEDAEERGAAGVMSDIAVVAAELEAVLGDTTYSGTCSSRLR